jgi:hypothetical protein
MGFSLRRAEQDFERLRRERIEEIQPDEDDLEDVWAEILLLCVPSYPASRKCWSDARVCARRRGGFVQVGFSEGINWLDEYIGDLALTELETVSEGSAQRVWRKRDSA